MHAPQTQPQQHQQPQPQPLLQPMCKLLAIAPEPPKRDNYTSYSEYLSDFQLYDEYLHRQHLRLHPRHCDDIDVSFGAPSLSSSELRNVEQVAPASVTTSGQRDKQHPVAEDARVASEPPGPSPGGNDTRHFIDRRSGRLDCKLVLLEAQDRLTNRREKTPSGVGDYGIDDSPEKCLPRPQRLVVPAKRAVPTFGIVLFYLRDLLSESGVLLLDELGRIPKSFEALARLRSQFLRLRIRGIAS